MRVGSKPMKTLEVWELGGAVITTGLSIALPFATLIASVLYKNDPPGTRKEPIDRLQMAIIHAQP